MKKSKASKTSEVDSEMLSVDLDSEERRIRDPRLSSNASYADEQSKS